MSYHDRDYMRTGPPSFGEWLRGWTAFRVVFALNVAVFIVQWVFQEAWLRDVLTGEQVRPLGGVSVDELTNGHFWTPFTFMFVHDGWGAFLGNMLLLWFAGRRVQDVYGGRNFVWIYLVSGLVGAAVEMAISAYLLHTTSTVLIGAAAPVLGLLLAYAVAMPEEEVPLFTFNLWTFTKGLMLVNLLLAGLTLWGNLPEWLPVGDVAYFAHLGGGLAGWYFARSLGYGGVHAHRVRNIQAAGSTLRRRPEMARVRRPAVEVDMEAVRRENPHNDPLVNLMKDEIDPILDKINDHGMGSLTDDERRALDRASRRLSK
ncbi:membrane associated rhomboid family serine protease [Prosthecobacter fusiformis]|uniref:Membrane associated rhomboid family serine protease n=1 Tax=Prosthecobacter fusiformis TaxID=48464 RepID=A0A4R7RUB4_9BACT|nr:rhomboid family intramembrane serine protease [Prosthecobacter fusiformis]TDU69241.1 membrane associated rhomboid family serine protease [Prosthecobacter fusiformis]